MRNLYRGPPYRGRELYDGGQPYGSELAWDGWLTQPASDTGWPADTGAYGLAVGYHRYLAYWDPAASFNLRDLRFTPALYQRLQALTGLYDSTSPDLRAFRAHGGKIILYHGWADQGLPPWATTNYYSAVARFMGGYQAIQSFSRLYMIPGLYHCPSPCGHVPTGDPAVKVDLIDKLVRWIEQGHAPDDVTFPVSQQTTGTRLTSLTVSPFNPLAPSPRNGGLNSGYEYLFRTDVYRPGRELWCHQRRVELVCSHTAAGETARAVNLGTDLGPARPAVRARGLRIARSRPADSRVRPPGALARGRCRRRASPSHPSVHRGRARELALHRHLRRFELGIPSPSWASSRCSVATEQDVQSPDPGVRP